MANDRINFYYDPARQGYDTSLLKTITGTPTISSGKLILDQASFIGYADIFKGELEMNLLIPSSPTAGDYRTFGLKQINEDAFAGFAIIDEDFFAITEFNGEQTMIPIEWNSDWTNVNVKFSVQWQGFSARFLINGVEQFNASAVPSFVEEMPMTFINDESVPKIALSPFVENDNNDSLEMVSFQVKAAQGYM